MQAFMPHLLHRLEIETNGQGNSPTAVKHELHTLTTLAVEIRTLIGCCDVLARLVSYSGYGII
jgi:hypothetical protein